MWYRCFFPDPASHFELATPTANALLFLAGTEDSTVKFLDFFPGFCYLPRERINPSGFETNHEYQRQKDSETKTSHDYLSPSPPTASRARASVA